MPKKKGKSKVVPSYKDTFKEMYGDASIVSLADEKEFTADDFISTGSIGIDYFLLGGGVPKGKMVEIWIYYL